MISPAENPMPNQPYAPEATTRAEVDAFSGATVVEFGTNWCGHCVAAQPSIGEVFAEYPNVRHLKIEDGSGRRLGRSFGVKLWPTLVFMRDGKEVARLVRPTKVSYIEEAFETLAQQG
jgi:thioredoxin 1